jgi:hypothetical protein
MYVARMERLNRTACERADLTSREKAGAAPEPSLPPKEMRADLSVRSVCSCRNVSVKARRDCLRAALKGRNGSGQGRPELTRRRACSLLSAQCSLPLRRVLAKLSSQMR